MKEKALLVRELVLALLVKLLLVRFSEDKNYQGYGKMGTTNLGKGKWKLSTSVHKEKTKQNNKAAQK